MSDKHLNYQQILSRGEAAAATLQSPVFQYAYQQTLADLTKQVWDVPKGHTKSLESLQGMGQALAMVTSLLNGYAATATAEMAKQQAQQKPAGTPDEYQGFGIDNP